MKSLPTRNSILASLALLAGFALPATAETITDRFEDTIDVAAGVEVHLTNTNGHVEVRTWDRDAVEIIAEKKVKGRGSDEAREALDAIEIHVREAAGRLEIETELPRESSGMMSWIFGRHVDASVSYEIRIPASASLDVRTVNGSVHSDGQGAEQRLRSTNGRITVEAAHAGVVASTTNGSISLEVDEISGSGEIEASTTNGSITLRVPTDIRASLEARTVNGSVRTDIPATIHGNASKRRMNADLNGGGDIHIGLRTVNGSIRIEES